MTMRTETHDTCALGKKGCPCTTVLPHAPEDPADPWWSALTGAINKTLDQEILQGEVKSSSPIPGLLDVVNELVDMMEGRHRKYGAGNIAKHGAVGIQVRMDDKWSRLEAGQENHDDETVENTLDDIIGYALIWKLWLRGHWPGSPWTIKS